MSLSVLNGTRSNPDSFAEFIRSIGRPKYAHCGVCCRRLGSQSATAPLHHNINRLQPRSNLRLRVVETRPPPMVRGMPHPTDNNVATWNNLVPPRNQPTNNQLPGYQPYPRGVMNGSPMIRAPNPSNANYGFAAPAPAGTRYPPYYENPAPVFAPDMRSQYNIQIRIPNIYDPLNLDDPLVAEIINSDTSPEENSDETEEEDGQEIEREKNAARLRKWIIAGGHPFAMIEKKEFIEFINELNPSYVLPTVDEMKSDMCADYVKFAEMVRQTLSHPVAVCITAESLISKNNCHYLAMTAHYIDKQFKKRSVLFDCCEMIRYDRTAIGSVIDRTLAKFNLTERVTTFVSDNKVLVKEMFAENYKWTYFGCYGLELKEIAEVLKQLAIEYFEKYCPTIRVDANTYLQDVIETLARVLPTVANFIKEYDICFDLIKVLKPFEELISFVGNKYIRTSEFMLINRSLVTAYQQLSNENFPEDIKNAVQTVLEKLTKLAEYEYIQSLAYATFLDPRYKNTVTSTSAEALSIKETFIEEVTTMYRSKPVIPPANNSGNPMDADNIRLAEITSIFNAFDKMMEESEVPVRAATDEVNRYMETTAIANHKDPLKWWADHVLQFPHLAKMAATHLNMQITSVPFDQIFTNAGKNMKEKRNRYDTGCLPMITFLSANPQYMDGILNDQ